MSVELKLGDKVWMHYGPSMLIVGHIVDHSPDYRMVGISPLPYDNYEKMTTEQKASCPVNWCELRACHYLCHLSQETMEQADVKITSKTGFQFINS